MFNSDWLSYVIGGGVEFDFNGNLIHAFLSEPVLMGSDEYQQVVPGFFALTCDVPLINSLTCPLIIHSEQQLRDLPFREPAVQIRKLNFILSEQSNEDLLKDLNIIIPAIAQMLNLIR